MDNTMVQLSSSVTMNMSCEGLPKFLVTGLEGGAHLFQNAKVRSDSLIHTLYLTDITDSYLSLFTLANSCRYPQRSLK